jgi:hypothetical protein
MTELAINLFSVRGEKYIPKTSTTHWRNWVTKRGGTKRGHVKNPVNPVLSWALPGKDRSRTITIDRSNKKELDTLDVYQIVPR